MDRKDEFEGYLGAEYRHIAEAHFRTMEAISSFFRYYLLIMSLPVTLLALAISISSQSETILETIFGLGPLIAAILFVISGVGFGVLLYIINLRMDAVLYARTINAIRKHFYDSLDMDINSKLRMRILPQTPFQPQYMEYQYFLPVVLSFALFDTFYLFWALTLLGGATMTEITLQSIPWWSWLALIFIFVHYGAYQLYAWHREHSYLKSYAVGVDIDGVLNKHRQHFCTLLKEKTPILLKPEEITTIPLHDCPALKVSREDEKKVFNDPRYWSEMEPVEDAAHNLDRLRNMNLKVHMFSHRAWPNTFGMNSQDENEIQQQWRNRASELIEKAYGRKSFSGLWQKARLQLNINAGPIEQLTKCWLRLNNLIWDKLTIERGNEDVADPQGHFRNRFYIARKKRIKFFVEDDLEKAIKLAYICDVVFLLDHPYNRNSTDKCVECQRDCKIDKRNVPDNIRRVKSWDEIYRLIRMLS
jgi:uncharacterized HAD superfamily protein